MISPSSPVLHLCSPRHVTHGCVLSTDLRSVLCCLFGGDRVLLFSSIPLLDPRWDGTTRSVQDEGRPIPRVCLFDLALPGRFPLQKPRLDASISRESSTDESLD